VINLSAPDIGELEIKEVNRVLESGKLAQGTEVALFEQEFSSEHRNWGAVATNAGTSALHVALLSLGIGAGDEVIVPSFTFAATANVVRLVGATPVFVDVEKNYYCIDPVSILESITERTKAIIPVHLYGQISDMVAIRKIADEHGLFVVEDAAQAHFSELFQIRAGNWGDMSAFSFYPTKNMTSGEGGMVLTSNSIFERNARLYRNQGMLERYKNEVVGLNYRMTDIHAAIGRVQLAKLAGFTAKRISNAEFLSENLEGVITPKVRPGSKHVFHQFTVLLPGLERDLFESELRKSGVDSGVYYPTPVHKLQAFNVDVKLLQTEYISKHCLSLPVHPKLTESDLHKIVECVNVLAKVCG
jgi:dTDP-4-amino-4,6-dideoxygalactose transaminase